MAVQLRRWQDPLADAAAIGRLHIVAIGSLACLTFTWLFTGRHLLLPASFAALDWFLVNFLNRTVDLVEDEVNAIAGTAFVRKRRQAMLACGWGALGLSLVISWLLLPALTLLRIAFHLLGAAYNWRVLPGGRRLKALYLGKNLASAMGFQLTVIGYPLAAAGFSLQGAPPGITALAVVWSMLFLLAYVLSYEVIYDLRDLAGDARAGVRSLPVVHGVTRATRLTFALIGSAIFFLLAAYLAGQVPWRIFVMIIGPLLQWVLLRRALQRGITTRFCTGLTWLGAALLLGYNLWVVLGLPGVTA